VAVGTFQFVSPGRLATNEVDRGAGRWLPCACGVPLRARRGSRRAPARRDHPTGRRRFVSSLPPETIWDEGDGGDLTARCPEIGRPATSRVGQDASDGSSMGGDPAPVRAARAHHQRDRGRCRRPSEPSRDLRRESPLPVERRQKLAEVDDLRFQLDHDQRGGRRVPGDQIDRATVAVDGERHLGTAQPPARSKSPSTSSASWL